MWLEEEEKQRQEGGRPPVLVMGCKVDVILFLSSCPACLSCLFISRPGHRCLRACQAPYRVCAFVCVQRAPVDRFLLFQLQIERAPRVLKSDSKSASFLSLTQVMCGPNVAANVHDRGLRLLQ